MDEIVFEIEPAEDGAALLAWWDDPRGGGISTLGKDLGELQHRIEDAVQCHFDPPDMPKRVRLHFRYDPVLTTL